MDYLKVFVSFADYITPLSDAECGRLFRAMLEYASSGTSPELNGNEQFLWAVAKQNIDREAEYLEKKREAGSIGGKHRQAHSSTFKQTEAPSSHKDKDKEKDKDNSKKEKREKKESHRYGEYKNVLLSDEDIEKLKVEFPDDYQQRIERLSEYIATTGKTYKSHLAVIRSWARNDRETPPSKKEVKNDGIDWMTQYIAR